MNIIEVLHENENKDLLRFVTAGNVDDGKSTLIGRLLFESAGIYEDQLQSIRDYSANSGSAGDDLDQALVTDGLKSEREQGITIDVAYRYFSTPRRKFIIADTPGHIQYTRNTATGASTAQLMLILIDARHGVQTQSKRHAFIASLLGIRHIAIAVNKMDLVDYSREVFDNIRHEFSEFMTRLDISDTNFIPVSALKGDNVVERSDKTGWYKGSTLLNYLETVEIASDANLIDMRFPVQYVCRPDLNFRGYMGSMASGIIRPGDRVIALPSAVQTTVKDVTGVDGPVEEAFPSMPVTVTLEDEIDLSRGDVLAGTHNVPHVSNKFEAMLLWMSTEPMKTESRYMFKHLNTLVGGEIQALRYRIDINTLHRQDSDHLELNEMGRALINITRPIAFDPYTRNRSTGSFIVIDSLTNNTVGAGMILDRSPGEFVASTQTSERVVSENISPVKDPISLDQRSQRAGHKPATIWLTGLTGSGKTTLARALEERLFNDGCMCALLDGENLRMGLNRDLGFSADDRSENIRRTAEVAKLFYNNGMISICSLISPSAADRTMARKIAGPDFFEIYLTAPDEILRERNSEGLYDKAETGAIEHFTGVTAPYETPDDADIILDTEKLSVEECVDKILELINKIIN